MDNLILDNGTEHNHWTKSPIRKYASRKHKTIYSEHKTDRFFVLLRSAVVEAVIIYYINLADCHNQYLSTVTTT